MRARARGRAATRRRSARRAADGGGGSRARGYEISTFELTAAADAWAARTPARREARPREAAGAVRVARLTRADGSISRGGGGAATAAPAGRPPPPPPPAWLSRQPSRTWPRGSPGAGAGARPRRMAGENARLRAPVRRRRRDVPLGIARGVERALQGARPRPSRRRRRRRGRTRSSARRARPRPSAPSTKPAIASAVASLASGASAAAPGRPFERRVPDEG